MRGRAGQGQEMASRDDEDLNRARRKERKGDDDDDEEDDEEVSRLHTMSYKEYTRNFYVLAVRMNMPKYHI